MSVTNETRSDGCLCGAIRYETKTEPERITICHCKFCQQATGSAYMIEPLFLKTNFAINEGSPKTYEQRSEGSGKIVSIQFCDNCGTKLFLGFERFVEVIDIYGGTFDNPDWFEHSVQMTKHIFLDFARHGTIVPAGLPIYKHHAILNDGTLIEPEKYRRPHAVGPN